MDFTPFYVLKNHPHQVANKNQRSCSTDSPSGHTLVTPLFLTIHHETINQKHPLSRGCFAIVT